MAMTEKFKFVRTIIEERIGNAKSSRLLDVGCRGCELRPFVAGLCEYEGLDMVQNDKGTVNHVMSVSNRLPFNSASYDIVTALDVIEHIDDMEGAVNELIRVSSDMTVLMLPNMAHYLFRLRFLFMGNLNEKYRLKFGQGPDRHRWLTTLEESDEFIKDVARNNKCSYEIIRFNDSKKKQVAQGVGRIFGLSCNLLSWSSCYVMRKNPG